MGEKKNQVFVISQIDAPNSNIRVRANVIADLIVAPVAEEFNLSCLRSDRDPTPGPVTPQILRSILASRVVVADLTGKNPNIYYELCFAQSFGIPVILLVDSTSSLPFDVKDERMIPIGDEKGTIDMAHGEDAKDELRKAFSIVLEEGYEPRSIVTEVAGVQSIERLTPENPMASELATLNRRVDQIHEILSSPPSRSSGGSRYRLSDVDQFMKYVNFLATEEFEFVTKEGLEGLVTDTTSPAFDAWVRKMIKDHFPDRQETPEEEGLDDLPF